MGGSRRYNPSKQEIVEAERKRLERNNERLAQVKRFAMKLSTIVVDNIITDIVRPGPKPEERECYDVANEIREHQSKVIEEIMKAIIVESKESDNNVISNVPSWIDEEIVKKYFKENNNERNTI